MKVLLVNGSPNEHGCTYRALKEIADTLRENGVDSEIIHIGKQVRGCIGCYSCVKTGKCFIDDIVNEFNRKAAVADGFVFGTPVYYASPNGSLLSFMDRVFFSGKGNFANKPAAAVCSARRGGTTATLDAVSKYFGICGMLTVGSTYWNMVHGNSPDEVEKDAEGLQTMRNLARKMAWLIKCIKTASDNGIDYPETEKTEKTNFIR